MNILSIIAGVIIGINILLLYLLWSNIKKGKGKIGENELLVFRDNVSNLITDFNHVSNTNINIMEDKTEVLRKVLALADEKIIRLNNIMVDMDITLQKRGSNLAPTINGLRENRTSDESNTSDTDKDTSRKPQDTRYKSQATSRKQQEEVIHKPLEKSTGISPLFSPEQKKTVPKPLQQKVSMEEKKERIYDLISAGFEIEDIARAVNISQTEVNLVLGLKDRT